MEICDPGVTVILPCFGISAPVREGNSGFGITWPNRLFAFLRVINEGMLWCIPPTQQTKSVTRANAHEEHASQSRGRDPP